MVSTGIMVRLRRMPVPEKPLFKGLVLKKLNVSAHPHHLPNPLPSTGERKQSSLFGFFINCFQTLFGVPV